MATAESPRTAVGAVGVQPAVQERICGRAPLLPLNIVVKPKVLPLPLDRMVMLPLPSQEAVPFQVVETCWGEGIATTTVQVLAPLTVTEVLYRSPQTFVVVAVAVQLPQGGGVVPQVGG
ncbi:hypothetical protein, partial [Micromonospora orduensis]|uniref:hypothetical protein n=1 Tax=Micromonospora orduensis TaxID=1420891 RepID=UPI00142F179B